MGARVEGTFAWVGGPFGQILAGAGAAALLAAAYAVITGRAPRCRLPVLSLALLPVLYALTRSPTRPARAATRCSPCPWPPCSPASGWNVPQPSSSTTGAA